MSYEHCGDVFPESHPRLRCLPLVPPNHQVEAARCPEEASCLGGSMAPIPKSGYWVDRSSYALLPVIYECYRGACKGPSLSNTTGNQSCWHQLTFAQAEGLGGGAGGGLSGEDDDGGCHDQGKIMCTEGSNGPFCGTCEVSSPIMHSTTAHTCSTVLYTKGSNDHKKTDLLGRP